MLCEGPRVTTGDLKQMYWECLQWLRNAEAVTLDKCPPDVTKKQLRAWRQFKEIKKNYEEAARRLEQNNPKVVAQWKREWEMTKK